MDEPGATELASNRWIDALARGSNRHLEEAWALFSYRKPEPVFEREEDGTGKPSGDSGSTAEESGKSRICILPCY